jgi:hypothetical protein
MIAASAVGIFVIPLLYVTFQTLRERSGGWTRWAKFRTGRRRSTADDRAG